MDKREKEDCLVGTVYEGNSYLTKLRKLTTARVPIVGWLPRYNWKEDFVPDAISGFTLACIHVPQGLAFAVLANVDPILGLYTACFPTLVYSLLGTAHVGSFGPVAIASMMIGEAVAGNSDGGFTNNEISTAITFNIGVYYLIAFFLRLGVLASVFTKPFTSSFVIGCALHVIFKTVKLLLGLKYRNEYGMLNFFRNIYNLYIHIPQTNIPTLIISLCVISILVLNLTVLKPLVEKCTKVVIPIEGIILVLVTVFSYIFKFSDFGVPMVGYVPTGLPDFKFPSMSAAVHLWAPALAIATINYSTTTSMTMMFNKDLRPNQDLFAMAISNLLCSNIQCITIGNSMMRTVIAVALGLRTLMSCMISSFILIFIIVFAGPLFSPLPNCVLGSIIMVGSFLLVIIKLRDVPTIFQSSEDGFIWVATVLFVVGTDIDFGMVIGATLTLRKILHERAQLLKSKQTKQSETLILKVVPSNEDV